ncbi:MAG: caspase family protein [Cocleimonas sp.]|nr:caspase family protein [Cocleimonas sp.]
MTIYCLLVGINEYKIDPRLSLNGCHNDVDLLSKTLQLKLAVKEENIKSLKSQQATRQNIIEQFQQHLTQQAQADDVALFYFSGHGAQSKTADEFKDIEPDGLEESFVCHDSRVDGSPDLRDKELRYLIKDLTDTGAHVVIFLDCCHGGHGTRLKPDKMEQVRMAPKILEKSPLSSYLFNQRMQTDLASTGGLAEGRHILMSACQDFQLSREKILGKDFNVYGLFTYSLCKTLNTLQYPVSYRELRNRVHAFVLRNNLNQSPQVEAIAGAAEMETVLGGEILPNTLLVTKGKKEWTVNAGAIHGLNKQDEITLFKESKDSQQQSNPITKANIKTLNSFDSLLKIANTSQLDRSQYSAIITQQSFEKMPVKIDCGDQSPVIIKLLEKEGNVQSPAHYLKHRPDNPDYILKKEDDNNAFYIVQAGDDQPLFIKQENVLDTLNQLASIARFWYKFTINNPVSNIPPDAVDIVIHYNNRDYINESVAFEYQYDGENWQQPSFHLELRLKPNYSQPLYCALLFFDGSNGDITPALLSGVWLSHIDSTQQGKLNAQPIVKAYEGKAIRLGIKDELLERGNTTVCVQDYLKLIICEKEFNASIMSQQGLDLYKEKSNTRGLHSILDTLMNNAHYRSLMIENEMVEVADWTSKSIDITITK